MTDERVDVLIAVCIPTFRRPEYLSFLLRSLCELETDGLRVVGIVVDNDPKGSAGEILERYASACPFPIRYAVERNRGIVSARNRLIAEARSQGADFVAFVDDDEWVTSSWVRELFKAAEKFNADVVMGPVQGVFEELPPKWIVDAGGYLTLRNYQTGTSIDSFSTANVLIKLSRLDQWAAPFDQRLQLAGGEDFLLSQKMAINGAKMVWSSNALVFEHIPPSRAQIGWWFRREYRKGVSMGLVTKYLYPDLQSMGKRALRSVSALSLNVVGLFPSMLYGRASVARRIGGICRSVGVLSGLAGIRYQEYREIHGR